MGLGKLKKKICVRWNGIPRARRMLMLVIAPLALTLSACDWTQFGYGAAGGRSSADTGISLSNVASTTFDWSYATINLVDSSPAVANGIVYIGSANDNVSRSTATTGALDWSYTTGGYVDSSPAVANGIVYIGSGDLKVYALNATTGAKSGPTAPAPG